MKIATSFSIKQNSADAIKQAYNNLIDQLSQKPDIVFLKVTESHDVKLIVHILNELCPDIPIHGSTSCYATMTQSGVHSKNGFSLSLFGIADPQGIYGVSACELNLNAKEAGINAAKNALLKAKRMGEMPALVWMTSAPGKEEEIIEGLHELFGKKILITGGSSADDNNKENWKQIANNEVFSNSVSVAVLFPTSHIGISFSSSYQASEKKAVITKSENRIILELNGINPVQIYNEWTDGLISNELNSGGNILEKTTLNPLGRSICSDLEYPFHILSHPTNINKDGSISLLTKIKQGEEIYLMKGSKRSLVNRISSVTKFAINSANIIKPKVIGAAIIYSAECMYVIKEELETIIDNIKYSLGEGVPFIGEFTFGEQGSFLNDETQHGNLMLSVLVFLE